MRYAPAGTVHLYELRRLRKLSMLMACVFAIVSEHRCRLSNGAHRRSIIGTIAVSSVPALFSWMARGQCGCKPRKCDPYASAYQAGENLKNRSVALDSQIPIVFNPQNRVGLSVRPVGEANRFPSLSVVKSAANPTALLQSEHKVVISLARRLSWD